MNCTPPRYAARKLAAALALTTLAAAVQAQAVAAQAASAPQAALPRAPHQLAPHAALYPDYYVLALAHTAVTDDPAWRALHLEMAPGHAQPGFIVLPVQTQAYGFSPTFRALLGARLDQELQRRHIDASRQTDIVDWRGPFVRRSDDATIAALAAEHPGAALLALYLGHDAAGHALLSLARTDAGEMRLVHRQIDIPKDEIPTLDAFAAALPALLAGLGLGDAAPAPALPAGRTGGCEPADWNLDDVPNTAAPVATACHALLMGTLMPDYLATLGELTQPNAPDRLAWLARAWVEASALAPAMPAMRSAATLASLQLRLDAGLKDASSVADDADVVVRPLARMLWARQRASSSPQVSRDETTSSYARATVTGLPDFAAAVVLEHAQFNQEFREVDLCAMKVAMPYFAIPAGCESEASYTPRTRRPAAHGQSQLLDAWSVAAAWNALYVEGHMRGSADRLARVEQAMPARIATHPLIRAMRFYVRSTPIAPDDIDAHLARTRAQIADYAQAIATLQHQDALTTSHPPADQSLLLAERLDPSIARDIDDVARLRGVEGYDFFAPKMWRPQRPAAWPSNFLLDGDWVRAENATWAAAKRSAAAASASNPTPLVGQHPDAGPTLAGYAASELRSREDLEKALVANPLDFPARITLATVLLEHGDGVAAARRVIDARSTRARLEDSLTETSELNDCANLFFFTGEFAAARDYYERSSRLDTGSFSDMLSKLRLSAIDGDVRGARKQAHANSVRYQDESSRADEAAYDFMLGHPADAWALTLPRLQTSSAAGLWRSALLGQRMAGTPLAALPDWIMKNHVERASIDGRSFAAGNWLRTYATLDRLPTAADIELLRTAVLSDAHPISVSGALVIKTAIDGQSPDKPDALTRDMLATSGSDRTLFMPFYGWAVWNASEGKDPALTEFRGLPLEAGFAPVLGKAMVLAADGQRTEALRFLTAARYELARNGGARFEDEFRTAAYDFVLATWLMTRKTGERAYAEQGLAIARGYQYATGFMGWPYAAEALLGRDAKARDVAACRAQLLDPGSLLLHESGLHPDPQSAVCRKATDW